jgi:pyrimidine operon attenuation protein / uracil phosphoribosyltransferase
MTKAILDPKTFQKALEDLATAIATNAKAHPNIALVGIRTRGVGLAQRLATILSKKLDRDIPVGILDITLYRDDLSQIAAQPIIRQTDIPFSLENKDIFLVDDVLYTGRTIRAALSALNDLGRPHVTRLVVMADRGLRELPIQADYVGCTFETTSQDNVKVMIKEQDGSDGVSIV